MAQFANQVGKATATSNETDHDGAGEASVGKQTLSEPHAPADPTAARLAKVQARAGAVVMDEGGFVYVVTAAGAFKITFAPHPFEKSVNAEITMDGKFATAWATLERLLGTTDDGQCVEPTKPGEHAPDPEPDDGMSIGKPAPSAPAPAPAPAEDDAEGPAVVPNDQAGLFFVATSDCRLKSAQGANLKPVQRVPLNTHVRVLEIKPHKSWSSARIATLDPAGGPGVEIGWVSFQHLHALSRPARPSTASQQMAKVIASARATAGGKPPAGVCYAVFKQHIMNGGGYGDILDMFKDERFMNMTGHAYMFHAAVQAFGPSRCGLQEVGGTPMQAEPGTILVLKANGKAKISAVSGDVSFIDGVKNGVVVCYNDGEMHLRADDKAWAAGGHMDGTLVAMYKPIDRA